MRFSFDHDYHIHSCLSSCSGDPTQTAERILSYAQKENLKKIVVTDHFWDERVPLKNMWYAPQNLAHIKEILPLPKADGVEFLFGCEGEMDEKGLLGISKECFDNFDFVVIPTTHMHMPFFEIFDDDEAQIRNRAKLWVERLDLLLDQDLPFHKIGIAHLACTLFCSRALSLLSHESYARALNAIDDADLNRLFARIAQKGCGVEINASDVNYNEITKQSVLRIFRSAKAQGCKFYVGSDAHKGKEFDGVRAIIERAIDDIGLTEEDKFHF